MSWASIYDANFSPYSGEAPDALPRKLDVHRGDTRLRLIVDAWNP